MSTLSTTARKYKQGIIIALQTSYYIIYAITLKFYRHINNISPVLTNT